MVHQTGKLREKHGAQIYIMVFPLPIIDSFLASGSAFDRPNGRQ
jgi:hypothetical protein